MAHHEASITALLHSQPELPTDTNYHPQPPIRWEVPVGYYQNPDAILLNTTRLQGHVRRNGFNSVRVTPYTEEDDTRIAARQKGRAAVRAVVADTNPDLPADFQWPSLTLQIDQDTLALAVRENQGDRYGVDGAWARSVELSLRNGVTAGAMQHLKPGLRDASELAYIFWGVPLASLAPALASLMLVVPAGLQLANLVDGAMEHRKHTGTFGLRNKRWSFSSSAAHQGDRVIGGMFVGGLLRAKETEQKAERDFWRLGFEG